MKCQRCTSIRLCPTHNKWFDEFTEKKYQGSSLIVGLPRCPKCRSIKKVRSAIDWPIHPRSGWHCLRCRVRFRIPAQSIIHFKGRASKKYSKRSFTRGMRV